MIDVMLITFMIEMKVDQPKPPEERRKSLTFFAKKIYLQQYCIAAYFIKEFTS
jgi:hypothetical protein